MGLDNGSRLSSFDCFLRESFSMIHSFPFLATNRVRGVLDICQVVSYSLPLGETFGGSVELETRFVGSVFDPRSSKSLGVVGALDGLCGVCGLCGLCGVCGLCGLCGLCRCSSDFGVAFPSDDVSATSIKEVGGPINFDDNSKESQMGNERYPRQILVVTCSTWRL